MRSYLGLLQEVLETGEVRDDRTGTGTRSVFGRCFEHDLKAQPWGIQNFPLLTTKRVHWNSVVGELLWFLSGSSNNNDLRKRGVTIWDEWADEDGDLGRIYGVQWTSWQRPDGSTVNQIEQAVDQIKNNPTSRRILVSAWNPGELDQMALPPCHTMFQFYVRFNQGKPTTLDCQMYQRSADIFLGVPFNIASYALLTAMMAKVCGLDAGKLRIVFGDLHLYSNHVEAAKTQLSRTTSDLPSLELKQPSSIFDFKPEDLKLIHYKPQPSIKALVAI